MSLRRALEAKAALYERLSKGEGLSADSDGEEGEGEGRYMVDFTRKIAEEVSVCDCVYVCIQYFPSRSSLLLEPETLISTLTKTDEEWYVSNNDQFCSLICLLHIGR